MTATTTALPLSGQAIAHLTAMAHTQATHNTDLTWEAWGLLRDLDYTPVDGDRFAGLWAEFVRVTAGLRAALAAGGSMWNWQVQARALLAALAGGAA
jgi:hypothetical protein